MFLNESATKKKDLREETPSKKLWAKPQQRFPRGSGKWSDAKPRRKIANKDSADHGSLQEEAGGSTGGGGG